MAAKTDEELMVPDSCVGKRINSRYTMMLVEANMRNNAKLEELSRVSEEAVQWSNKTELELLNDFTKPSEWV